MDQQTDNVAAPEGEANPNLNLGDLVNLLQVMRTCAVRGAFRADEMSAVGALYDRLQNFLVASGAIKVSGQQEDNQPAGE